MRLRVPTDGSLRMHLEILLLYALVWASLAVLSSTAKYPLEACRFPLIARRRSQGQYGRVHSSLMMLRIDCKKFSKCDCHLDHSAT